MVEKKKKCSYCLKDIDLEKEKYVMIGTYFKKKKFIKERFYHWNCWQVNFKELVIKKQKSAIQQGLDQLNKVMKNATKGFEVSYM